MQLYEFPAAPNPRRVGIFVAEKGISIPRVLVDLTKREQFSPEYRAINPRCMVPALVLDDGTVITEVLAICRYLEEIHPDPPLLGTDARDQALVTMWERRMELDGLIPGRDALRNAARALANHALSGPRDYAQIPALAERGRAQLGDFFQDLDDRLATVPYVAGERFSMADITAIAAVDFAIGFVKLPPPESLTALQRWYKQISARPSVVAATPRGRDGAAMLAAAGSIRPDPAAGAAPRSPAAGPQQAPAPGRGAAEPAARSRASASVPRWLRAIGAAARGGARRG